MKVHGLVMRNANIGINTLCVAKWKMRSVGRRAFCSLFLISIRVRITYIYDDANIMVRERSRICRRVKIIVCWKIWRTELKKENVRVCCAVIEEQ